MLLGRYFGDTVDHKHRYGLKVRDVLVLVGEKCLESFLKLLEVYCVVSLALKHCEQQIEQFVDCSD